jgi:hypothetical protein
LRDFALSICEKQYNDRVLPLPVGPVTSTSACGARTRGFDRLLLIGGKSRCRQR